MQYHIQTLVKHLFDKDSFEQVTVQELKQFTDDYPYAAVGQFLYAKKLKDSGSYNNYEQCEQASLYFHNSLWLRWQLEQKEETPALPKADESMQQPGFRIVVQMPKAGQPAYAAPPLQSEEKEEKQEESTIEASATGATEEAPVAGQPAEEQTAAAAGETTEAEETSLQVNEDGSLVEQVPGTSTPEEAEEAATTAATEAIIKDEIVPAIEATPLDIEKTREQDEIVPAVEATPLEVEQARTEDEIVPAVEALPLEVEKAREQDEVVPAVEVAPEELATITDTAVTEQSPAEDLPENIEMPPAEIAIGEAAATGISLEEQPVAALTEIIKEEPAITAETEKPATEEPVVDNTTARPQAIPEGKVGRPDQTTVDLGEPIFESYHTIDYFASQGVKLMQDDLKDRLGKKMKSFTDWLRSMKRVSGAIEGSTSLDEVTNQSIQRIAEHSVEEKEVLTEAMAEVWAKQGNAAKAIRVYQKLSLLNPAKSTYFAGRIEQLKAQ